MKIPSRDVIRSCDLSALQMLILPLTFGWFWVLTLQSSLAIYLLGQIIGAFFLAQIFILQHEAGHFSFFKRRWLNWALGGGCSLLSFVPFYNWIKVHDLHHKWTGWRDMDPTTKGTVNPKLSSLTSRAIDVSWKYYLPLFTFGYRFGIYWKPSKVKAHLSAVEMRIFVGNLMGYGTIYLLAILTFPELFLRMIPSILMSFVVTDIITLSQHSHIVMPLAGDEDVRPHPYGRQVRYSRSLEFPRLIAKYLLFNFNLHEAHHAYPGVPAYNIPMIEGEVKNSFEFSPWLREVKKMRGTDFVFTTDPNRKV